jgi:UDP-N-acetylglucosamine 2-epimerase
LNKILYIYNESSIRLLITLITSNAKIVTIAGNRPELIKLSEVVKSIDKRYQNVFVYTGQHFSRNMSDNFLNELGIEIDYNLCVQLLL